ncbi:hypothetical protein AA103196_2996 [Ameyamaea chiangmaiensis NBRC 103196]|uniref:Uncharacterized protein n=1 Tax=Ameyamaea chiangmaiensis TaxID=442969 RepID=A0A850P8D9_9PROT|nr:hypothetical protein [Ameyamaea chiangmaiensis]MBS4074483.1 hypothetical protein [Ameyamaea chiangmaiensis]NVN39253.1 hypothetical protein [Ameyamaea chiangmaiensis]GBQ72200.1 hypothetical protein AA103196_2996 [Ameyamaea chiangmaiensis NBRC 103196]
MNRGYVLLAACVAVMGADHALAGDSRAASPPHATLVAGCYGKDSTIYLTERAPRIIDRARYLAPVGLAMYFAGEHPACTLSRPRQHHT